MFGGDMGCENGNLNSLVLKNTQLELPSISYVSNLRQYEDYVNSIPNLDKEDELKLLALVKNDSDIEAAKKLILSQLKTVVSVAKTMSGYGIDQQDLIQEGNIGLIKAVGNFDYNKNVRLYTYALIWIKAEMQAYVMKNSKLIRLPNSKEMKKLFFNFRSLQKEMMHLGISDKKINEFMSNRLLVSQKSVEDVKNYFLGDQVDIDQTFDEDGAGDSIIDKFICCEDTPETEYELKQSEQNGVDLSNKLLDKLNQKQRYVIDNRLLSDEIKTYKEIAKDIGVSPERVRQIEKEALNKMKEIILGVDKVKMVGRNA